MEKFCLFYLLALERAPHSESASDYCAEEKRFEKSLANYDANYAY